MNITPKEAAEILGVSVPTLRRWSKHFAEFLSPTAKSEGGKHRSYREEDLAVMARAKGLLEAGLTYARVAEVLAGEAAPTEERNLVPAPSPEERREDLLPVAFQEVLVRALELAARRNDELTQALQTIADQKGTIVGLEKRLEDLELAIQRAGSSQELERLWNRLDILEKWQRRSWLARFFGWW